MLQIAIAVLLPRVTRQFACAHLLHAKDVAMHLPLPDFEEIYKSIYIFANSRIYVSKVPFFASKFNFLQSAYRARPGKSLVLAWDRF
jgi:hypothetical protein